ncbi:restriction endonuclease subunit S [Dichelobacter nodosus]
MTEVGVIPEDWKDASLGELAEIRMCKRIFSEQTNPTGDIPFFKIGTFGRAPDAFISGNLYREYKRKYSFPKKGDVLLSAAGTLGKTVIYDGEDAYFQDSNIVWLDIDRTKIKNEYLYQCYQAIKWASPEGSTISRLYNGIIRKTKIPLPPTETEQRAIAQALSDVDALLATLDKMIAKKRDLKQATMQQLLTGETRLPGFSGEWQLKRLGDVVDTDPENLGADTATDFWFNYISLEDVDRGQLRSHSEQVFIDAPSRARRKLMPNDVLVSTVRPNLQSHLLFKGDAGHWVCSTGFCVIRCREGVTCPAFVFSHFFAADVNRQIDTLLTGSNYPAINSGDVRNLEIMFPSYVEQCAIATVLSEMDAELSALEARRDKTHNIKQAMMQELLTGKTRLV